MIPVSKPVAKRPPAPTHEPAPNALASSASSGRVASLDASAQSNTLRPMQQSHKPGLALPGTKKTLWQSWLSLRPSMRMALGASVAVFAVLGMAISDKLQKDYPAPKPSGSSSDDSDVAKPRRFGVRLLDRVEPPPAATDASASSSSSSSASS